MLKPDRLTDTEKRVYQAAMDALAEGTTAPVFSAQFFGADSLLAQLAPTKAEREALVKTELYKWLQQSLAELRHRDATAFRQQVQALSGRLTVVVPKSLHGALREEAAEEGVSLSELIRLKLAIPYMLTASVLSRRSHEDA